MVQIYHQNLWGGVGHDYYSGEGSHDPIIVAPYVEALNKFLNSFERQLIVCDLGCGDFNVGRLLFIKTKRYIAVDIVPDLIDRNRQLYKNEGIEFHCLDIAKDTLPSADCAIVRQVLQHLSNSEIQQIITQKKQFEFALITEHTPNGDFLPNKDIISGQGTRLKIGSGVDVLKAPFNLEAKAVDLLLAVESPSFEGVIKTHLYRF